METTQTQKKPRGRSRLKTQATVLERRKNQDSKNKSSLIDLLLALFLFFSLQYLMFYSSPNDSANLIFPNSYLLLITLVFFFAFFFLKFILKKTRLAFCLAFNLLILLFFRLQDLDFNYYLVMILAVPPLIWLIINQIEKRLL